MICNPGRCESGDALDGRVGEFRQDVSEIVAHRDIEPAAAAGWKMIGLL